MNGFVQRKFENHWWKLFIGFNELKYSNRIIVGIVRIKVGQVGNTKFRKV